MPKRQDIETISEILVDPRPQGLSAVFMVETRSAAEASQLAGMFSELAASLQVRQLSRGKLVSYAVQADESDAALLEEIEDILKRDYAFVLTQHSFDDLIYCILTELCRDTRSRLIPVPKCNICGKQDPFPGLVVNLSDQQGAVLLSRNYCSNCAAGACAPSNKEFVKSLLAADERDFGRLERAELIRRPSRKRPIRFRIKAAI